VSRLRVGILGPGGIAARHASAISSLSDRMELVASCGRDLGRAQAFASRHGGLAYSDLEAMLRDAAPDLVVVTLPPFAHQDEIEQIAAAGAHLLVEKPIALDQGTADRMLAAARQAGIVAAVGFMYRFGEAVRAWRAADTGRNALFTGAYHCNALHAPWWRSDAKSGGQMVEQLIHQIDLVRHFMGEPDSVFARRANLFHRDVSGYDAEDLSALIFGWDDGRLASLTASNIATPGEWRKEWTVFAEKMTGRFDDWNRARFTPATEDGEPLAIEGVVDPFVAQLADVAAAIAERRQPHVPLSEGAKSLHLALAARRSADERREIRLGDVG
jgi:predicted dehydrogenase